VLLNEREVPSECASFDPEKVFGRMDGQSSTDIFSSSESESESTKEIVDTQNLKELD